MQNRNFSLQLLEIYSTLANISPGDWPIGESIADTRQYIYWTPSNWRLSIELLPIHSVEFRQLSAKVKFGELPESHTSQVLLLSLNFSLFFNSCHLFFPLFYSFFLSLIKHLCFPCISIIIGIISFILLFSLCPSFFWSI